MCITRGSSAPKAMCTVPQSVEGPPWSLLVQSARPRLVAMATALMLLASEMDGACYAAFSNLANLHNFNPAQFRYVATYSLNL